MPKDSVALTPLPRVVMGFLVLLCIPAVAGEDQPKVDPQTGMIRLLFIGDSMMEAGGVAPFIAQDPMIALTPIPFTALPFLDQDRLLRMYYPRHERDVYERYDVVIIAEANVIFFPARIQMWIKDGVVEHGVGFLMAGGPQSFGGYGPWGIPGWEGSIIEEVLPVTLLTDWTYDLSDRYHLVPTVDNLNHPLIRNIPWEQVHFFCRNRVVKKPGSVVVGESDFHPPGSPVLTYWEIGRGLSEAFVFDWGGNGPQEFHRWAYAPLVTSNLVYYPAGVAIPEDTTTFLRLRTQIIKYLSLRRFVLSVIDFAEKFGANLNRAEEALRHADEERRAVVAFYLSGDHAMSLASLEEALANLEEVSKLALRAKDEALFWVYVIEWFTVSGTAMLCGAVLWSLMVRRTLYREVDVTRLLPR